MEISSLLASLPKACLERPADAFLETKLFEICHITDRGMSLNRLLEKMVSRILAPRHQRWCPLTALK